MKLLVIIVLFGFYLSSPLLADIKLEPSKILLAQDEGKQKPKENSKGFTEMKDANTKEGILKKPWQAFFMSFLIPGTGEHYTGSRVKSKAFFIAEIGFWSAFASFRHLGSWRQEDYKLFAAQAAGADVNGKDDRFFDVLGFYDSREQYNKVAGVYDNSRQYFPDGKSYFWRWQSLDDRNAYKSMKDDSKSYYRKATFALGLIAANHFLSAVDSYISAKRFNRGKESGFSGIDFRLQPDGWQVVASARF
jgi:hypothetical protein